MTHIRNLSASDIPLDDLGGITIVALSDYNLNEETQNDIANSQDLNAAITAGDIVFLDPQNNQLTQQESLDIHNAVSATFPAFNVTVSDANLTGGPFSKINFKGNVSPITNIPSKADIDILPSVGIFTTLIDNQEKLVFNDPNRSNKILSVDKASFLFVQSTISSGTWFKISKVNTNTQEGYVMPYNGTIVGISSHLSDPSRRTGTYDIHFDNDAGTPTIITFSGSGEQRFVDNTLDYDFVAGQVLQFRCDSVSGGGGHSRSQYNMNVVIYVRWRG